jgi:hypothetical protein
MRTITFFRIENDEITTIGTDSLPQNGYSVNYCHYPDGAFYVVVDKDTGEVEFHGMFNDVENLDDYIYKLTHDGEEHYVHACEDAVSLIKIDPATSHIRHLELKKKLEEVKISDIDLFIRVYGYSGVIDLFQRVCETKKSEDIRKLRNSLNKKLHYYG